MKSTGKILPLALALTIMMFSIQGCSTVSTDVKMDQPKTETTVTGENKTAPPTTPSSDVKPAEAKAPEATLAKSPTDVLAKVNGVAVTRADVDRLAKAIVAQNKINRALTAEETKQLDTAALDQSINGEILYQAGLKKEIKDLDKQVEAKLAEGKKRLGSEENYNNFLKTSNMTDKELQEMARREVVINNLLDKELTPKLAVSEADVRKFYDDNLDKFKTGDMVKASHILVKVDEKATAEEKTKAKEKAEALRQRLLKGEDFAKLAKAESDCPSKEQGGDLGPFGKGVMVPAFETVAFALNVGDLSEIVETQFGYHIIKLTEKKSAGTTPYTDVKDKIFEFLKSQNGQKSFAEFMEKLKKEAKIDLISP